MCFYRRLVERDLKVAFIRHVITAREASKLRDAPMIVVLADCKILLSPGRELASSKSVAPGFGAPQFLWGEGPG